MIEILSFVFGGLFRLAPEALKFFDKKNERSHELAMLDKQLEADKARAQLAMQQAELQGKLALDLEELKALIASTQAQATPLQLTGNKFLDAISIIVDALSKAVRPLLTYWYCVVAYGAYKYVLYMEAARMQGSGIEALGSIWTKEDHAVMFSIIGYWFVDRTLRYMGRG